MGKYPPSRLAGRSRSLSSRVVRDVTRKPRDWNEATAARSLSASRTPVSSRPSPSQALYAYLGIVVLPRVYPVYLVFPVYPVHPVYPVYPVYPVLPVYPVYILDTPTSGETGKTVKTVKTV